MSIGEPALPRFGLLKEDWGRLQYELEYGSLSVESRKDPSPTYCAKLESEFAKKWGRKYALSFNSCTSAIFAALSAVGVRNGAHVIVSPLTCYTSVLPVSMLGGVPVFCDINPNTLTLSPAALLNAITPKTKAVLLPYVYGMGAETEEILKICNDNGIVLIEDCAASPGVLINNRLAGTFGKISCFSFAQGKLLDSGEGGIALTDDEALFEQMLFFKEGGKRAFRVYYPWGANSRMTNFTAFLGLHKLNNLQKEINARARIADIYFSNAGRLLSPLNNLGGAITPVALFKSQVNAQELIEKMNSLGVNAKNIYKPLNTSNIFTDDELLLQALCGDKEKVLEFKAYSKPTPNAFEAFMTSVYFEVSPMVSKDVHQRQSEKIRMAIGGL